MKVAHLIEVLCSYVCYINSVSRLLEELNQSQDQSEDVEAETELLKAVRLIIAIKKHHGLKTNGKRVRETIAVDEHADYYRRAKEMIRDYKQKLLLLRDVTNTVQCEEPDRKHRALELITESLNDIRVLGF